MRAALLLFLAVPGSVTLLVLALRELVKAVRKSRQAKEDEERAERIALEYAVPQWAVEEPPLPTGRRRVTRELPEITSRYTEVAK